MLCGHDSSNLFLPPQYKPQPRLPTIHMLNDRILGDNHIPGGSSRNILVRRDKDGAYGILSLHLDLKYYKHLP